METFTSDVYYMYLDNLQVITMFKILTSYYYLPLLLKVRYLGFSSISVWENP